MKANNTTAERAVFIHLDGLAELILIPYNGQPSPYLEMVDGKIGKLIKVSNLDVLYYEEIPAKKLFK
jgi:hypothetical protein